MPDAHDGAGSAVRDAWPTRLAKVEIRLRMVVLPHAGQDSVGVDCADATNSSKVVEQWSHVNSNNGMVNLQQGKMGRTDASLLSVYNHIVIK